jgi:hypothetical protein
MKPFVRCECDMCRKLEMSRTKQYEAPVDGRTQLDLLPYRFDVGGNRVTGELDSEKTPDSGINIPVIEIIEESPDTFGGMGGYFLVGVGIGMVLFVLALVCMYVFEGSR